MQRNFLLPPPREEDALRLIHLHLCFDESIELTQFFYWPDQETKLLIDPIDDRSNWVNESEVVIPSCMALEVANAIIQNKWPSTFRRDSREFYLQAKKPGERPRLIYMVVESGETLTISQHSYLPIDDELAFEDPLEDDDSWYPEGTICMPMTIARAMAQAIVDVFSNEATDAIK